jgi:hypothetical protein
VVAHLQLLGKIADREPAVPGGGADGEERLVLVRRQVFGAEQILTEALEFSHLIAKHGESFKIQGIHGT